jgi:hypothetical protein
MYSQQVLSNFVRTCPRDVIAYNYDVLYTNECRHSSASILLVTPNIPAWHHHLPKHARVTSLLHLTPPHSFSLLLLTPPHSSALPPPLLRPSSAPRPPLVRPSSAPRPPFLRPKNPGRTGCILLLMLEVFKAGWVGLDKNFNLMFCVATWLWTSL